MPKIPNAPIRIVIADNHPLIVQALAGLFRTHGDLEVVAGCHDGKETLRAVREHAPDVVLLDPRFSGTDGLEVIRQVRALNEAVRVVVHTAALSDDELAEVKRLGVAGVVLKDMAPELLIRCVRRVHAGEQWIGAHMPLPRQTQAKPPVPRLTEREVEVLRLTATGVHNREVAHRLRISECTVKAHLSNIYEKLGLESRLELSVYAQSEGIL